MVDLIHSDVDKKRDPMSEWRDLKRPFGVDLSRQIKAVSRGVAFLLRRDVAENLSRKNH